MPHAQTTSTSQMPIPSEPELAQLDRVIAAEQNNEVKQAKEEGAPAARIAGLSAQEMEHHLRKARARLTDGHGSGGEFEVIRDLTDNLDRMVHEYRISRKANSFAYHEYKATRNIEHMAEEFLKDMPNGNAKDAINAEFKQIVANLQDISSKQMKAFLTAQLQAIDEIMKKVTKDAISIQSVKEAAKAGSEGDKWCQKLDLYLQEITDDVREFLADAKNAVNKGIDAVEQEAKARGRASSVRRS
jgi:hypothetical protein